jgi:hypothetical protein
MNETLRVGRASPVEKREQNENLIPWAEYASLYRWTVAKVNYVT